MTKNEDPRSDVDPGPRMLERWKFDGRTFRAVRRVSGVDVLEVLDGQDAMGVERWVVPSRAINEEINEDVSGLVAAALVAALDREVSS